MIATMLERFAQMPSSLQAKSRWMRLGESGVPALVVHPSWDSGETPPLMIWMHGRTVNKELDPGRYLRWMRAGIATCAVDLPGHGERYDAGLQEPAKAWDVVSAMVKEIDVITASLADMNAFNMRRLGIGGMSAGGMAATVRLCRPHVFVCASVEAATGSWEHQRGREMFLARPELIAEHDPIRHLDHWREIPFQAIHARFDEWVSHEGQAQFVEVLRSRYRDPSIIDFVTYEHTGAPNEHAGFGNMATDAKNRQRDFLSRWLISE